MTTPPVQRVAPPTAEEIERRFASPVVRTMRPMVNGGVEIIRHVRRFQWVPHNLDVLEGLEPPIIFAANHMSHVDTAAILGSLPRRLRSRTAVAAALDVFGSNDRKAIAKVPNICLQYLVASGFHAFAFDRHGPPLRSIRTALHLVRNGWNLLLYPEGTRSRSAEIKQFKLGVGVLAKFTERPVVPIHVYGGDRVLPCNVFLPRSGDVHVRLGTPMRFTSGDTPQAFVQRLRQSVQTLGRVHHETEADLPAFDHTSAESSAY